VESLFDGFSKEQEIMSAINDFPLSATMGKLRVQYIHADFQIPLSSDVG
jgi:hypothetical protein